MAQTGDTLTDDRADHPRRDWYALEERHSTLLKGRAIGLAAIAAVALVEPRDLAGGDRALAAAACGLALALHALLRLVPMRWPRRLLLAVDASLVVDAALVFALAHLSGGIDGLGVWLLPPLAVAVTVGYSEWFGAKALILAGIVVAALYAVGDGPAPGWEEAAGPLVLAVVVSLIAGGLVAVDRRDTLRRERKAVRLHAAASALLIAADSDGVAATARTAVEEILSGWQVTVALGVGPADMRSWRDGDRALLEVPIPGSTTGTAIGRITASRLVPRFGRVHVRGRQLSEARGIAAAAGAALERIADLERLAELSMADALTGLGNRRAFDEALEEEIARAVRAEGPVGLVMLDVDHFKRFNDRHGHQAGDAALAAVADVLTSVARAEDRACRVGGEEFAVLLPGADERAAAAVAERIREGVEASDGPAEGITVSLGVAAARSGTSGHELVAAADERLYAAKAGGRNRVASVTSA